MKLSVVALFAAGAMAAVVPDTGSYGEQAPAPSAPQGGSYGEPAPSESESPEAPEDGSYGGEVPAPTSAPVQSESPEKPSTVVDTEVVETVTDCGPEVTNCAGDNVTSTLSITTSICETEGEEPTPTPEVPGYSEAPSGPESESPEPTSSEDECEEETTAPVPDQPSYSEAPSVPLTTGDSSPEPTSSVCVPETNVKTITTEYTTVVPTTILETETVPCPEPSEYSESPEGPTGGAPVPSDEGSYPEPSATPSAPGNET